MIFEIAGWTRDQDGYATHPNCYSTVAVTNLYNAAEKMLKLLRRLQARKHQGTIIFEASNEEVKYWKEIEVVVESCPDIKQTHLSWKGVPVTQLTEKQKQEFIDWVKDNPVFSLEVFEQSLKTQGSP